MISITQGVEAAPEGKLTVNIDGLKSDRGVVRIALFNTAKSFSDNRYGINGAVKSATLKIKDKKASWTVKNLPFGDYAVRTFHDVDETGKFKVNRLGIPKYEYGFSNNARAMFGPPSFESSKFEFSGDKAISITMHR